MHRGEIAVDAGVAVPSQLASKLAEASSSFIFDFFLWIANQPCATLLTSIYEFILVLKILLKLLRPVALVQLQEQAAGEPNSNPVPWIIGRRRAMFPPPP